MVKVVHFAMNSCVGEEHVSEGILDNTKEYDSKKFKNDYNVPGGFCGDEHAGFHRVELGADKETVAFIRLGYSIPFDPPPPVAGVMTINKSCEANPDFCWADMVHYTKLGCA